MSKSNNMDEEKINKYYHIPIKQLNQQLRYRCEKGDIDEVKLMIKNGADDWNGGLRAACEGEAICQGEAIYRCRYIEIAELMIEKGADKYNNINCNVHNNIICDKKRL